MKKTNKLVVICNIASFVLIVALAVMQFMPFWYTVNGVHMTPAEYEEYLASEDYVYTGEKIILEEETAPEATEAVPEATEEATEVATEAVTEEATEAVTEEATEAATETTSKETKAPEKLASEEGYYVIKCYACDTVRRIYPSSVKFTDVKNLVYAVDKCKACKSEVGFSIEGEIKNDEVIAWEDRVERASIAERVWFITDGAPVLMFHVWTLLLGAVCFYFCLLRSGSTISFLPVTAIAVLNTIGYLKPEAMTGSSWIIHMILSCLLFVPGVILFAFWLKNVLRWFKVKD